MAEVPRELQLNRATVSSYVMCSETVKQNDLGSVVAYLSIFIISIIISSYK